MNVTGRIDFLFSKYIKREISGEELEELLVWMYGIQEDDKDTLSASMQQLWHKAKAGQLPSTADKVNWEQVYKNILSSDDQAKIISINKKPVIRIWRWAAAVAILIAISTGGYYLIHQPSEKSIVAKKSDDPGKVLPGTHKAILTLADGTKIVLDSAVTGTLAQQGGAKVIKLDSGKLAYTSNENGEVVYNTISTPRATTYQVILSDGTKVWLNAGSSLRFPTVFSGSERKVELTGEGYFEVAHNTAQPFKVKITTPGKEGGEVEVLGTHFNIMAYPDEEAVKTTLLEGSVKISATNNLQPAFLKPGQQAQLNNSQIKVINANTELAVAWVKGYFYFDKADIKTILRQAGRWYDLDIVYEANVPDHLFSGKMERDLTLSGLLRLFKEADINFRLEGKKLIVLNGGK
ncbi:MAG: iron dicitrate transport regulator FecR [Chitinophagaceae bacterium]|nr:iron dicitrate transport regulator FecR [Chitinophagaceae bacterium]